MADSSTDALMTLFEADKAKIKAQHLERHGRWNEAESHYRSALDLTKKALGDSDPEVAKAMDNLATVLCRKSQFKDAEQLLRDALAMMEKAYYADHYNNAPIAEHLADCLSAQGRYDDAEPLMKRAMDIYSKTLVGDHHEIVRATQKLAEIQCHLAKYPDAETLLKKAAKAADTPLGPIEEILYDLAVVYQLQSKDADAKTTYKQAIALFEQRDKYHRLADCLDSYAGYLEKKDRKSDAEPLRKRADMLRREFLVNPAEKNIYVPTLLRA
jgi:tetratricopeptide (TPR) repeat protein